MSRFKRAKNLANHVAFVLDASGSMSHLTEKVIEVADRQVAALATNSQQYNQETRISIWVFSDKYNIECAIWDMDVLRFPSIAEFYKTGGQTALIDATTKGIDDLNTVSQVHGDHSFLMYVWTDGEENNSLVRDPQILSNKIKALPDNWTVAALVPDIRGVAMAKQFGFPAGNIQMWDASSKQGMEEAHEVILRSHTSFMQNRATGMQSTKDLFDMSAAAVNKQTIQAAGLTPLEPSEYQLIHVEFPNFKAGDDRIDNFTTRMGYQYITGRGYYQLTLAPVKVQVQKEVAVVEKSSGRVYTGKNARALLGLPDDRTVTLKAADNPNYDIFIQSTSLNRKLLERSTYLYLTPNVTYVRGQAVPAVPTTKIKTAVPKVAKMPSATPRARLAAPVVKGSAKTKVDLTAPVYPKAGKALWAGRSCPDCPSKATQRCQKPDGSPMEKPHERRKA